MAPPAVVYVFATVVGVAAVFAFKEFIYEPHIAPTLEAWAEDFLQRRRAARSRRASAVPVRLSRRRASSDASDFPLHENDPQRDRGESERSLGLNNLSVDELELEALASKEVDEWRNEVLRSQERIQTLRRRKTNRPFNDFDGLGSTTTTLDEASTSQTFPTAVLNLDSQSFACLHTPLTSTHVILSSPLTPSTVSLPYTPTRRPRSVSESTTQETSDIVFIAPHSPPSPIHEISVMSPGMAPLSTPTLAPRPPVDTPSRLDTAPSVPLAIPISDRRSPGTENALHQLPLTPTHQVVADDSPFGPLLPDTPRSSAEIYGQRPFSPITRVMGSSSNSESAGPNTALSSSFGSTASIGTIGTLRKPSGLANEVAMGGSDEEDHPHTSPSTSALANSGLRTNESVISSLSERYPAPPTPPVMISPSTSSVGIISAPSSPRSSSPEIVAHQDTRDIELPPLSSPIPQTHPSLPLLQLPSEPSSPALIYHSRSEALSPALSYASFLSPMPMSRAASESEGDEFLSVAGDDSDWSASPVTSSRSLGPVPDSAHNPFFDFEHLTHDLRGNSSEHGSEGSEVLVSEHGHEGGSELGSDASWRSARKH